MLVYQLHSPIVQLVEHCSVKAKVAGSWPARGAMAPGLGHCSEILYMKEWDKEFIIFVWCVLGIVYTSLILSVIYVYVKVGVL